MIKKISALSNSGQRKNYIYLLHYLITKTHQ